MAARIVINRVPVRAYERITVRLVDEPEYDEPGYLNRYDIMDARVREREFEIMGFPQRQTSHSRGRKNFHQSNFLL